MIQVPESIIKRNEERQGELAKKREIDGPSQSDGFREAFRDKQVAIEDRLNVLESEGSNCDRNELAERFNGISKDLNTLNKYLTTSSGFLVAYDIRVCKDVLQSLQERLTELETRLLPRKKFGFKVRKDLKSVSHKKDADIIDAPKAIPSPPARQLGFADLSDEELFLGEEVNNKDVTLSCLSRCTVRIHGSPSTIQIVAVSDCRVISGPVVTSVFIDNCHRSTFAFPCQQLRAHHTTDSDFYLHVTTRAVIEYSTRLRFAPYKYSYDSLDRHYESAGLDLKTNNWNLVEDFNWLVNNKQSPNWSLLGDSERVSFS